MSDYVKVPKSELAKLEESRKMLYDFVEKYKMLDDTWKVCELLNITEQIWKVANTKNWYHSDATDPLKEKSNSSIREFELTFKVNVFDDKIATEKLSELLCDEISCVIRDTDNNTSYEIISIELNDN